MRAPSPLDALKREQLSVERLQFAGLGDPAKAPAELVAIVGDHNEKTGWNGGIKMALRPDDRELAYAAGGRQRVFFRNFENIKYNASATSSSGIVAMASARPQGALRERGMSPAATCAR
jgi:hypothetical protein